MSALDFLTAYGAVALLQAMLGLLMLIASSYWDERRDGARLLLSCPIWPVVLIRGLWHGIKHVIAEADLPALRGKP